MTTLKDRQRDLGMFRHPSYYDPKDPPKVDVIRVCCISDTHTEAQNIRGGIPQCDLLIHSGDITYRGEYDKLLKFDDWGGKIPLPKERKICIAGNHDKTFESDPEVARAHVTQWTYLQDEAVEVLGLKIYGSPWSTEFYPDDWAFNHSRGEEAAARWAKIPEDTDILVVHGPPYGYGDRTNARFKRTHVGCVDLANRLDIVRPRLTVCGHIHEDFGLFAAPWGLVVNACTMTDGYRPKRPPIVIDIPLVEK
jgi:Icc-related predicted phosphoesterase